MRRKSRHAAIFAVAAVVLLAGGAARAQWYSSAGQQPPPLYPYVKPSQQPYAVEVAPNTYVIHRPSEARATPARRFRKAARTASSGRTHGRADPALIEELRKRNKVERTVVDTTQVVQDKPIVNETTRYVDDPPRVVERRTYVEDRPERAKDQPPAGAEASAGAHIITRGGKIGRNERRVISADAEITILGPDSMSIRLFRKGGSPNAKADAE
jgi:hypothetical protein